MQRQFHVAYLAAFPLHAGNKESVPFLRDKERDVVILKVIPGLSVEIILAKTILGSLSSSLFVQWVDPIHHLHSGKIIASSRSFTFHHARFY